MKVFLLILCITSFCAHAFSQPLNEKVSAGLVFDGEPYLAINPINPENMVIAWMSFDIKQPLGSIRIRSSFDGGLTWGNELTMPHYAPKFHSADVSMAFHNDGKLYIAYIDYSTTLPHDSGVIVVAHSLDGGKTWSTPDKAFDAYDNDDLPIDRPWIVVDNSGTSSDGMLYITTKSVYWDPLPNHPYFKSSADGG